MRIYRSLCTLITASAAALVITGSTYALDASKIIKSDTKSSTIFEFFFDFMNKGQQDDALDVLKYAAEQGNSAAQWKLAKLYERGEEGVERDDLAAFRMYQRIAANYPYARPNSAAWQFSADALVALGNYYRRGIPETLVFADPSKAQMMYTTAAMVFKHPDAQFELGRMQIHNDKGFGQGRLGVRNLKLAYEKGHVGAEALLGYARFEGVHAKRNVVRGLIMLANAKRRATVRDLAWIAPLHDEAFALARPDERALAHTELEKLSNSLQ
ncbi:MAG: tetratricopeptide repeat protein [Pseudomonadota bacterium]